MKRRSFIKTGALTATAAGSLSAQERADDSVIRVGLIGMGHTENQLKALTDMEGVEMVALSHPNAHSRKRLVRFHAYHKDIREQQEAWIRPYENHQVMLDEEGSIDAVIVNSHEWLRPQHVIDCLKAGKHVYLQPSLGHDLEKVREMVRAAKESDRVVQVGYHRRSLPHYRLAKEKLILKHGLLKPMVNANLVYRWSAETRRASVPKKERLHIPLETLRSLGYESMEAFLNWRFQRRYSIGILGSLPAEMIDSLLWLSGELPNTITAVRKVGAHADTETSHQFHITMEFGEENWVASFQIFNDRSQWRSSEVYVGKGTSLTLSDRWNDQNFLTANYTETNEDLWKAVKSEGLLPAKPKLDPSLPEAASAMANSTHGLGSFYRLPLGQQKKPYQYSFSHFIESIRNGTPSVCSIEEGYRTELVLHKILEAAETRRAVNLSPADYEI